MATCLLLLNGAQTMSPRVPQMVRCPACGIEFARKSKQPRQKFCSSRCAGRRPDTKVTKPCLECGTMFTSDRCKNRSCCSQTCSMKHRWKDEAVRARYRKAMANKSETQIHVASERMKRMNKDVEFREKADSARRGRPFAGTRGGNGTLTPEQKALAEATGYAMEFPVRTGITSWRCAMLDLANPALKIAVEVDGRTHTTRLQIARDRRKA